MKATRTIGILILALLLMLAPAEWLAAQAAQLAPAPQSAPAVSAAPAAPASQPAPAAFSQDDAVRAALEFSSNLVDKRAAVDAARLSLDLSALWRASKIDLKAGASSAKSGTVSPDISVQASAPLVTGLSLGASYSTSMSASTGAQASSVGASVSYKPFAQEDLRAKETLDKALVALSDAERQARLEARAAYRSAWLALLDEGVKAKALEAAEAKAEAASLNADAGAADSADVIDAETARIDAMVALLDSRDAADAALSALSTLVGRSVQRGQLADPDPGAAREPMAKADYLAGLAALRTQALDLASAERAARPAMPDLGLTGSLQQALGKAGATPSWSLSASVSLDPDTFLRGPDQASALALDKARRGLSNATRQAEDTYAKLVAAVAARRSALDSAAGVLESAKLSWEKNSYLAEAGTVSGASLLDAEKNYLQVQYRVAKARADLGAALDALDPSPGAGGE